jgi:hypothetical protein
MNINKIVNILYLETLRSTFLILMIHSIGLIKKRFDVNKYAATLKKPCLLTNIIVAWKVTSYL